MITVSHAYSASNSGDGLLVRLSLDVIRDAVGPDSSIEVLAIDPDSFPPLPNVQVSGLSTRQGRASLALAMARASCRLPALGSPRLTEKFGSSRLVVAVGGGYMRAPGGAYSVKSYLAHTAQARIARDAGVRRIYLPQSVGPLRGVGGHLMAQSLKGNCLVWARDDRTLKELERYGVQARRAPDLAVLEIGRRIQVAKTGSPERVLLVARDLQLPARDRDMYIANLKTLLSQLDAEVVLQSTKRGNNDAAFYEAIGLGTGHRSLKEALADGPSAVVVSVRLHGSLEAILSGSPSVHLSYERKGFGAFNDLGIPTFVHNARSHVPADVVRQVRSLLSDSREYWTSIGSRVETLRQSRADVVESIRMATL